MISGVRAYDMALRLQYDDIPPGKIDTKYFKALKISLILQSRRAKQIFCSYTAMTAIRRLLCRTDVEEYHNENNNCATLSGRDMNLYGDWGNTLVLKTSRATRLRS